MTNLFFLKGESIGHQYVFIFYALLSLINYGLIFLLPETKGKEIPDSVYETENYSDLKFANDIVNENNL